MRFLDKIFKKQVNPGIFSFLFGLSPPEMKEIDYLKAYKGWVYSCVNAIAEEVATLKLHLMRKTSNGIQEIDNHIAINLLHDVNSFMSSSELFLATQAHLELNGNALWYLPKGKIIQKPAEIWILDPSRFRVVKNQQTFVSGYVYQNERGESVPLEITEVIHFKRFNPLNRYRGMGTVQAAALAIDIDTYSSQWNRSFFYNSAIPSGVIETEKTLTDEQFNRIKSRWESQYRGVENAHKFAVLEDGLKYKLTSLTQKEMDFLEQRRFSRDEILGIFRVPKTVLGIVEDVNRANAEASEYVFARRVVKPRMQFIVDRLNEFYIPLFALDQKEYFFTFDDPVPQNVELVLKRKQTGLAGMAWYTPNEVRKEEGKPPVSNGNQIYIPVNLMPMGAVEEPKQLQIPTGIEIKGKEKKDEGNDLVRFLFEGWDSWVGVLYEPTGDALRTSLTYAGKEVIARIGIETPFDLTNPRVLDWLSSHALEHARSVTGSIKEEVALRVMEGVEQGLSIDNMADSIGEFFDKEAEWRAVRIARTEVISGYAEGTLEGMRQADIKLKKWLTAGDDRVDPDCEMNERDGAIDINSSFSSGNTAPPVHPNCRCILQEVVGKNKQTKDAVVEKRVRFIASEIAKRRKDFHKILLDQKAALIKRLKQKK